MYNICKKRALMAIKTINSFTCSQKDISEAFNEADSLAQEEKQELPSPVFVAEQEPESKILLVGKKRLASALQKRFDERGLSLRTMYDPLRWSRDARVCLPNKTHLVPAFFPHKEARSTLLFHSLLPENLLHFYYDNLSFIGRGCTKKFRKQAVELARQENIPYKEGKTCIEGGNCYIFTASDGKPKAIIGYTSLILSFISLYNQSYFAERSDRIKCATLSRGEALSDDLIRIAKNFNYFEHKRPCLIDEFISPKAASFWTSLSLQMREMIQLTKEAISEELMIPVERTAYIFQSKFHIDMEVFVGPNDCVFIHDETQMLELQEAVDAEKMPFLKRTLEFSRRHLEDSQILIEENTAILQGIGCNVVPVPGVLTASYLAKDHLSYSYITSHWTSKNCLPFTPLFHFDTKIVKHSEFPEMLNFMNGIFLKPNLFITTAAPDNPITLFFQDTFYKRVKNACPELDVLFLEEDFSRTLIRDKGLLRCLTSEFQGL